MKSPQFVHLASFIERFRVLSLEQGLSIQAGKTCIFVHVCAAAALVKQIDHHAVYAKPRTVISTCIHVIYVLYVWHFCTCYLIYVAFMKAVQIASVPARLVVCHDANTVVTWTREDGE